MSETGSETRQHRLDEPKRRRNWLAFLPLAVIVLLGAVFLYQLLFGRDPSEIPSALIGEPAPQVHLAPIEGLDTPAFTSAAIDGEVTLVNVFASWCVPCRQEHPFLMQLAENERLTIAGINYKDAAANARRFIGSLGNPYDLIGVDPNGKAVIDWGVYGVPESFLVGRDGTILYKHVGPLTPEVLRSELLPAIEKALSQPS